MLSAEAYRARQAWIVLGAVLIGSISWGLTGQWKSGLFVTIFMFLITEAMGLLITGFKPRYYEGNQIYKRQEKFITTKGLQVFQLPRTIIADEK